MKSKKNNNNTGSRQDRLPINTGNKTPQIRGDREESERRHYRHEFRIRGDEYAQFEKEKKKMEGIPVIYWPKDLLDKFFDYLGPEMISLGIELKIEGGDWEWDDLDYEEWPLDNPAHGGLDNEFSFAISRVNKKDMTITVKIHLDQPKDRIIKDIKYLLSLLDKEAQFYNIYFGRKKKRPLNSAKSVYDKYDLLIEIWDKVKKEGKTIPQIAREKFPEIFKFDIDRIRNALEGRKDETSNIMPWDGDEDEPMPIDQESAIRRIRRYYDEAQELINGGWRRI
jgi:hypothetical protein